MQFGRSGKAEPAKLPSFPLAWQGRGKGRGAPGDFDVALAGNLLLLEV
jgi:hypothetical protein